jgi:hypothetical protein
VDPALGRAADRALERARQVARRERVGGAAVEQPQRSQLGGQALEVARTGRLVHAMHGLDLALDQPLRDRAIGREHRLLDRAVRVVARRGPHVDRHAARVEREGRARQLEVERARGASARAQRARQLPELAQHRGLGDRLVAALDRRGGLLVGQARAAADHRLVEAHAAGLALRVELHLDREYQPVDLRAQRADVARQPLGQHRDRAIGEVHAVAAPQRLAVDRRARRDPARYVRDRDLEPKAVARALDAHGVVVVARGRGIDRHERVAAQIAAPRELARVRLAQRLGLRERVGREVDGQLIAPDHGREVGVGIARAAQPLDHARPRRTLLLRTASGARHGHRAHDLARARAVGVVARDADPPVALVAIGRDAEHLLVSAQDADPVIARAVDHREQLGTAGRERRDQHAVTRLRVARVVDPVLATDGVARAAARQELGLEQPVRARHAPEALVPLDAPLVFQPAQRAPQRAQLVSLAAQHAQQAHRGDTRAAARRERADDPLRVERQSARRALGSAARIPAPATLRRRTRAPHGANCTRRRVD